MSINKDKTKYKLMKIKAYQFIFFSSFISFKIGGKNLIK